MARMAKCGRCIGDVLVFAKLARPARVLKPTFSRFGRIRTISTAVSGISVGRRRLINGIVVKHMVAYLASHGRGRGSRWGTFAHVVSFTGPAHVSCHSVHVGVRVAACTLTRSTCGTGTTRTNIGGSFQCLCDGTEFTRHHWRIVGSTRIFFTAGSH